MKQNNSKRNVKTEVYLQQIVVSYKHLMTELILSPDNWDTVTSSPVAPVKNKYQLIVY